MSSVPLWHLTTSIRIGSAHLVLSRSDHVAHTHMSRHEDVSPSDRTTLNVGAGAGFALAVFTLLKATASVPSIVVEAHNVDCVGGMADTCCTKRLLVHNFSQNQLLCKNATKIVFREDIIPNSQDEDDVMMSCLSEEISVCWKPRNVECTA